MEATGPAAAPADAFIIPLRSITDVLDVASFFPRPQPLEIELGSGDGTFFIEHARRHPETSFLGVERLLGRLRKTDRRARRAGLANVRLLQIEAAYFLEYLLPPACACALHIYFADPWPKRRHRHHRLIGTRFPALAARVLTPGGHVWLRTDNTDYFAQMTEVFAAAPRFTPVSTPGELSEIRTDFEREFNDRGIPTNLAGYRFVG